MEKTSFQVSVYGKIEPYNSVISKARVRIFYKGYNRNGTYISDEFAEKLLSTLSYSPICGIYEEENGDFADHGETRQVSKAYGVVPENPNISWERHLDDDGVERDYACADVFLWTARYKEASEIPGKSQSMELYDKSIKGFWKYENGKKYYEYTDASFIGLAPLGDNVEPCFEGAAFYSLASSLSDMVKELKEYTKKEQKGGQTRMTINFKLSDSEKYCAIWDLLNPNFNEENNWTLDYAVQDIYDQYALVYSYEDQSYYRVQYTKDDETNSVTLGNKEKTFIMDVSESELSALKALKALNGDTYEKIDEVFSEKDTTIETLNNSISEKETSIETLTQEKEAYSIQVADLNKDKEALEGIIAEKADLEKQSVIDQYSNQLSEEIIGEFSNKISEYTLEDLKKELALKLVESNPSIFSKNSTPLIPQDYQNSESLSPAARILSRRMQNKNNGGNE